MNSASQPATPALIEPRTLSGFRDYLPAAMLAREDLIATARRVYRSFGFSPIETPCLEYEEILTGKGGEETDRQLYRFVDSGGRRIGLRFDLTVPLARFAAQHISELGTPFKRYHIATVWRGEKAQRGRLREFMQADFDTVGTTSVVSDIETALVIHDLMRALHFDEFTIHVNDRKVLNGLLEKHGLSDRSGSILRALDKLAKVGPQKVMDEMVAVGNVTPDQAAEVLALAQIDGDNDAVLAQLERLVKGNATGESGLENLRQVLAGAQAAGVPHRCLRLDASIARGLDYYTGTVFETFLARIPTIGSVCSGGRYDNLAGLFTRQQLPGIGASLGLDRLLVAMEELGLVTVRQTPADALIVFFEASGLPTYLQMAAALRATGLSVEVYPEARKLAHQLKYADRRGFRLAILAGSQELQARVCQLKDLRSGESETCSLVDGWEPLLDAARRILATS